MTVKKTHHIDKSDLNEHGRYDYFYEFDVYAFTEADETYWARSYTDAPLEAHFINKDLRGERKMISAKDRKSKLFGKAVAHLRQEGKQEIRYLGDEGYVVYGDQ